MITVSETISGTVQSGRSELKESAEPAKESGGFQDFLDKLKQKETVPEEARKKAEKPALDGGKKPLKEKAVQEKSAPEKTEKELSEAVKKKKEDGREKAASPADLHPGQKLNKPGNRILPEKKETSVKIQKKSVSSALSEKQEQGRAAEITGETTAQINHQLRNVENGSEKTENLAARDEGTAGKNNLNRLTSEQVSSGNLKNEEPAALQITDLRKAAKPGELKAGESPEKSVKKKGENGTSAERELRLAGEEKHGQRTGDARKAFGAEEKRTGRLEASQTGSEEKGDSKTIHVNLTTADEAAGRGKGGEPVQAARQLSSRLQEDLSAKIVKHASIVVKSERSGEIKLILHPENLGRVRIQLQLEDNRIAGRIFVDNTSVREAFEGNLKNLERAFQQDGFDSAKLEVFVGDREQDQRRAGSGKHPAGFVGPDKAAAVDKLGMSVPSMERYYSDGDTLIDLVV
jgi:flagellar hook-length control protein FliK